jgi:hypothetical protein
VNKTLSYIGITPGAVQLVQASGQPPAGDIDAIEAIGADGFEAIASALDMFKAHKKD